jgi:hypothetical protein
MLLVRRTFGRVGKHYGVREDQSSLTLQRGLSPGARNSFGIFW